MTLEQDWERLTNTCNTLKEHSPYPNAKIFFGIKELRKADNRGIDFVIRRLKSSEKYGDRIRLYGAPTGVLAKNPLRVKTNGGFGFQEYKFDSLSIKSDTKRTQP